ncbi:putative fungal trichothecene efflux pump (TRI12) [Lyophyllum shimeji]|uniref:Fungal trichothecene efflux pump (TRI12) n=1 Tax=Lyophyllum shimeji TaxID=47721 RepID=A0A9P3PTT0_LYOSH|nr:putative fungal trichothecene efflux pump (TRI12) [Lyophyllum shimeji]
MDVDTSKEARSLDQEKLPAVSADTLDLPVPETAEVPSPGRDLRFWLVFVALCACTLISAIDLAGVGTAAPTIVHDLQGKDFAWVSSAYTLSSAACIPLSGNVAQIFGRRPVTQVGIVVFAAGSAIAGAAPSMVILIFGRAIQGVGGGIIQSLTAIITTDLVPLRDRGLFTGITGLMWTLGSGIAPFIAGGLSEKASWRWLFYLNLPLCGLTLAVVTLFLQLNTPTESFRTKFFKIDWIGNAIIVTSACSCMLALIWGGIQFPWTSYHILLPLILGISGLAFAVWYEARYAGEPTIPLIVLSNRTSISGYIATFVSGMVTISLGFFLPTWFQAVQGASPVVSGLHFLPWAISISPFSILQGRLVSKQIARYRTVNLLGWCTMLLGLGLLITLKRNTSIGLLVLYQLIMGAGGGLLYSAAFAVLAPLPVTNNAAAVALLTFLRVFAQAWGVAIGGTILQNALKTYLPSDLLQQYPEGAEIAYSLIPNIPMLPEPLRHEVQDAFVRGFRVLWTATEVICAVGALSVLFMRDVPLRTTVDKRWGLKTAGEAGASEGTLEAAPPSKEPR